MRTVRTANMPESKAGKQSKGNKASGTRRTVTSQPPVYYCYYRYELKCPNTVMVKGTACALYTNEGRIPGQKL
jgi:hypothetical protein